MPDSLAIPAADRCVRPVFRPVMPTPCAHRRQAGRGRAADPAGAASDQDGFPLHMAGVVCARAAGANPTHEAAAVGCTAPAPPTLPKLLGSSANPLMALYQKATISRASPTKVKMLKVKSKSGTRIRVNVSAR